MLDNKGGGKKFMAFNFFKKKTKEQTENIIIEKDGSVKTFPTIGHERLKELTIGEEFKEIDFQGKEKTKRIIGKEEIQGCLIVKSIEVM